MSIDKRLFEKLLREKKEQDWFDFKSALKLYQSDGKLVEKQRDELLKDILGLANGNSNVVRKTKYLIVGADNNKFDENGMRVLHHVDYKVPEQSDLMIWLNNACTPSIVGVESEIVKIQDVDLFVITIQPTFDLHETKRELITPSANFTRYTVFMRQDEHTVPASVRDGAAIQQLKQLYRQEISNPPAIWLGATAGAITALIIGMAKMIASQTALDTSKWFFQLFFVVLGIFFGGVTGFFAKQVNETRYDWRYMRMWQKIALIVIVVLAVAVANIIIK